jgi:hypothetical protein
MRVGQCKNSLGSERILFLCAHMGPFAQFLHMLAVALDLRDISQSEIKTVYTQLERDFLIVAPFNHDQSYLI